MSAGGNRFQPAFKGDWYDVSERTVVDSHKNIDRSTTTGELTAYIYSKQMKEYRKERVTSAEHIVREASGVGTGAIDLFSHSMEPADITETAGLHHWYDKKTLSCTIEFNIMGIAKMTLIQQSKDPTYTRSAFFSDTSKRLE